MNAPAQAETAEVKTLPVGSPVEENPDDEPDLFDAYAVSEQGEQSGVWTTLPRFGTRKFLVARKHNKEYNRQFRQLYKPIKARIEKRGPDADDLAREMNVTLFANTILLGWEGKIKYKDVMYPYTVENAKKFLALREFFTDVDEVASDVATFLLQKQEADEKN